MDKEFQVVYSKDAFEKTDDNAKFLHGVEQNADVLFVFVRCGTCHQKNGKVREDKGNSSNDLVFECLERLSSVPQTQGHTDVIKLSKRNSDCRFRYISGLFRNRVMGFHQVNHAVKDRTRKTFRKALDVQEKVAIGHCSGTQGSIVVARSPVVAVFLPIHVQRRGPIAFWGSNDALQKYVIKLMTRDVEPLTDKSIGLAEMGGPVVEMV